MKVSYYDSKSEIHLETYADSIVIEKNENKTSNNLIAIRLGGYPESVKGMAEAIYGGGTITVETDTKNITVMSYPKRYRKQYSHDGIYAESTLLINDEEQINQEKETGDEGRDKQDKPRKCYLFCGIDDTEHLFTELDKKTSVPLIDDFKDYILFELQNRGILKKLEVISFNEQFDVWALHLSQGEQNIIDVVNDGLKYGHITIPNSQNTINDENTNDDTNSIPAKDDFANIQSVTGYLNKFGIMIAERIKSQFQPLFDPAAEKLSPEIFMVNDNIKKNTGYSLYDAQLAVAEAHKRCLNQSKSTLCIAECGSGKTKIGLTALHAYQQQTNGNKQHNHKKHFNIVLCPSHMVKKWIREIEESLPNTFAVSVSSITEINSAYEAYLRDDKTCYIIISKEKARDGYMKRPAVMWNKRHRGFICPSCNKIITMDLINEGSQYKVTADQLFFRKETKDNHKCEHCDSLLWTVLVPEKQSKWIKLGDYGFVHRYIAYEHLERVKKNAMLYDKVETIVNNPNEIYINTGAYRRFPLSTYIKYKMKGKIDGLIIDEIHNYNNNSGQGDAMGELFQASKKVIGMTATLINGYSSGIFHLLYRISPELMLRDGKSYYKSSEFNREYGVTESVFEIKEADYNSNRRTSKKKVRERQLPGVSSLVYSRFLMDSAAFLSLSDMGKNLPEYEEIPVQLSMTTEVQNEYERIENQFKDILRNDKAIAKKILSSYMGLLTVYPNQPYNQPEVKHPITGDPIVIPKDTSCFEELSEKDLHLLDIVQSKTAKGEKVLVYTSWIRIDTQDKLMKLFEENGYCAAVLNSTVAPNKREEWVEKQVQNGLQVLITNPSLVETGLDLNDFTTIYYYNISYNLFTLRQSSRRSWRINQKSPRIEVYFAYYEGTMQHRAIKLMASKLAVAGIIEGNFTDEGLAAMSDCADMTTALARELTMGIKNDVEDLSAVFRKMAILKPVDSIVDEIVSTTFDKVLPVDDENSHSPIESEHIAKATKTINSSHIPLNIIADSAKRNNDDEIESSLFLTGELYLRSNKKKTVKSKKPVAIKSDNQLSLFDYLEVSSA